jgi:DNA-binding Lrp family transcriptional regulator
MVNNSRITGIEIAQFVEITERALWNIISDLERDGYISKTRTEKQVQYQINPRLPLRQKSQRGKDAGRLLRILSGKRNV